MSTYTQIFYHVVFSTKNRVPCLAARESCEALFRYIWGIVKNNKSHLYRINGVEDHIHMLTSLHQSVCLADFVRDIKVSSSKWIKQNHIFEKFTNWQDGYGAFTHSNKDKNTIIEYIKNQAEHHKRTTFFEEYKRLLLEAEIEFDEKYLL